MSTPRTSGGAAAVAAAASASCAPAAAAAATTPGGSATLDPSYYVRNNPFKRPERSASAQLKWTIGILLLLGAFAFWAMSSGTAAAKSQGRHRWSEPKKVLDQLEGASLQPIMPRNATAVAAQLRQIVEAGGGGANASASAR